MARFPYFGQNFGYCFGNYVYKFLIYFSFLINILFNADSKNAICFWRSALNAELGRLCPFSAPRGRHFQLVPLGSPPRVFHGQIFTPDKHKVSAPNAPSKSDPNYSPLKKLKRLEKISLSALVIYIYIYIAIYRYHNC